MEGTDNMATSRDVAANQIGKPKRKTNSNLRAPVRLYDAKIQKCVGPTLGTCALRATRATRTWHGTSRSAWPLANLANSRRQAARVFCRRPRA